MQVAHPAVVERLRALLAEPAEADALLAPMLRRFLALKDRSLRRVALFEAMSALDDASLLGVLHRVDRRAAAGDAACRWLSTELALTPSVLLELPYERTVDLYAAAREADQADLARRFLGAHPPSGPLHIARPAPHRRPGPHEDVEPVPPGGIPPDRNPHFDASPGVRTAQARGRDRMVLDRLLHDRDPRVVAALLDNPRVTERDVVRIAAMRPTLPEILEQVAAHARWGHRYRVRKALAFNPATPWPLARQLLPTLLRQHLEELNGSRALTDDLREEVRRLLARG